MDRNTESRKDFITRITKSFQNILSDSQTDNNQIEYDYVTLSDEQTDFLKEYEQWLLEFNEIITDINNTPKSQLNNIKLMEHISKVENHKPRLEIYMKDPIFAAYFNHISRSITNNITI